MNRRSVLHFTGLSWMFWDIEPVQASAVDRKVVARINEREIVTGRDCSVFTIATNQDGFKTPIGGHKDSKAKLILDGITIEAKELFFNASCHAKSILIFENGRAYQGLIIASAFEPGVAEIYLDTMREVPK